ncbi:MAG: vWA domain-containing protein [Lachnospiraceae bacterium]|nr:vWA domain-containing protein [Lachnospiraceae bacterium]
MKNKKRISKFLSVFLSLAFVLTMIPSSAFTVKAAEGDSSNSGVVVDKTATLEEDGTYTINLSAYATGTTTTITEKSGTPLDIVLVIDQSGSMAYNDDGRSTNTQSNRRMEKLKDAVNSFVGNISSNAKEYDADHRIAIAGYASNRNAGQSGNIAGIGYNGSGNYWINTGLYVNGSFKNYAGNSNTSSLTAQDYKNALVSVNDANGNVTSSITTAVNSFKASGGTYTEYGMTMAKNVFDNNPIEQGSNRKRIVVLFTDGETNSDINTVLNSANTLKGNNYDATIYSVGFGSSVDADFLGHVSSNYSSASYSNRKYSGTAVASKYSMTATNREELNNIFNNISQDIQNPSTTVALNADSVMRDVIGDGFKLPEGYDASQNVTIKTVAGSTTDGKTITWGAETTSPAGIAASVDGQNVNITGFNYSNEYIAPSHNGKKLVVTIRGVEATDAAVKDAEVDTNAETSGIYATSDAESCIPFPQPKTILTSKSYVLDYAKEVTLNSSEWKQNTLTKISGNMAKEAAAVSARYGKVTKEGNAVKYQPTTTNWDGYDSFYAFGKTTDATVKAASANANGNLWSKVNVIPANNVYYEDDFVTDGNGTVGIEYSGTWNEEGNKSSNKETANGDVQGWETSLADDTGYSDGSAHVSSTSGSTASFKFTGTGVDIYSRTNQTTGTIYVTVKNTKDGTTTTKRTVVDNKAKSGDYYQIPTYTFSGAYGTYEVTVRVTTGAASEGRYTYYLDGIRVYNPIQDQESDQIVKDAYGADELNAVFTEVRGLLDTGSGVAFVDEDASGNSISKNYEDAEVSELAPEHEVYLASGQSIVFSTNGNSNNAYYLGLKAPAGTTSVAFSDAANAATTTIGHTSDLYYTVTPSDGKIVVKNTGDNLLSITKLRTAGSGESGISTQSISEGDAVNAVNALNAAKVVTYKAGTETEEELTEETSKIEEPETTVTEETGNVTIDNEEPTTEQVEQNTTSSNSGITSLFNNIKSFFGRR